MSGTKPGRGADQFALRLPDGMRDRIRAAAEANNRSMNAEIVATLLEKYPPEVDPDVEALIEQAMKIPPKELNRIIKTIVGKSLEAGRITEQDIEDGIVPGVWLSTETDED